MKEFPSPALELNPPGYTADQVPVLSNISTNNDENGKDGISNFNCLKNTKVLKDFH